MSNEHMDAEYPKIDLIELLHGLFKSAKRLLLPGVLLVAFMAGLMFYRTWSSYTPRYQASASFTVHMVNPLYSNQQYYNNSAADQMAKTFPQILTSGVLSEQVKAKLGIGSMPSVSAEAMGSTNILTLTVTSTDPQLAYDVLNCVMEIYPSVSEFVVGPTEIALLSESGIPTNPTNTPDYTHSVINGVFVGGALWAGLVALYWFTHQTVSHESDLGKVVNLPCLGHLPRVRGVAKNSCPILSDSNDKFGFNESVHLLRVRVEKALAKENGKVLLVTSTIPNEGKTTVAINIATALAQKGKIVLLVDYDLRNPSISTTLGVESEVGFSEFLRGKCTLKEALHKMDTDNLYIVFGGEAVANPEKLLAHDNAKRFVEAAKQTFDYIILDTPPCAMMADAAEIGALADCALLTVRQDFAARQQIRDAVQTLGDNTKPIIGTVLNMATAQLGKDSYYSYYGYGYGYYASKDEGDEE